MTNHLSTDNKSTARHQASPRDGTFFQTLNQQPTAAELIERLYEARLRTAALERDAHRALLEEVRQARGANDDERRALEATVDILRVVAARDPSIIKEAGAETLIEYGVAGPEPN